MGAKISDFSVGIKGLIGMAVMTDKLHAGLQKIFLHGIGGDVVYGVRYVLADALDVKRKNGIMTDMKDIYAEAVNGGFPDGALCSAIGVNEGAALVLSIPATKQLMLEIAQASGIQGWESQVQEGWLALDVALAMAKGRLAEYVISQVHKGVLVFDAALFGNTPSPLTQFLATMPNKQRVMMTYPCFNLAHTDISNVNAMYLIPRGYRINRVTFRGFLPGKAGILATLTCERLGVTMA